MLTEQQHAFFDAFGFIHLKQVFSAKEFEEITSEADKIFKQNAEKNPERSYQTIVGFVEQNAILSRLAVDERIHGVIEELLASDFVWGNSEGNKGSFNQDQLHNWHCDRVGEYDMQYARLKVMIYLTPTTRDGGALRVMPGSHRAPLHQAMVPLNSQGDNASQTVFGISGSEVPGYPLESNPGDVVFFNHYLFHAVYGKSSTRRYITLKYADKPTKHEHFESLKRHCQGQGYLHQAALSSTDPKMQRMLAPLIGT
ncbi:MAG: hypothetical protein HOH43_02675 [Candidatus Latescibacteria bacterium]|jgi:hypothetical protein|nr:hypothetical protein [Candidatus Latescibacterota bacterium]